MPVPGGVTGGGVTGGGGSQSEELGDQLSQGGCYSEYNKYCCVHTCNSLTIKIWIYCNLC